MEQSEGEMGVIFRGVGFTISADEYNKAVRAARDILLDEADDEEDEEIVSELGASAVLDAVAERYVWLGSQWLPRDSEQVKEIQRMREWNNGEPMRRKW